METGILHTHTTVVALFLALYLFKVVLLVIGNKDLLNTVRAKTKVLDMIFGTLILATGSYLAFNVGTLEPWLIVKMVVVIALIPVGIIAMKKESKVLALLSLLGFVYFYGVAETRSLTMKRQNYKELTGDEALAFSSEVIYQAECQRCHGNAGDGQHYGAANLKTSKLNTLQLVEVIRAGQGSMKGYGNRLSEEQLNDLAEYIQTFRE